MGLTPKTFNTIRDEKSDLRVHAVKYLEKDPKGKPKKASKDMWSFSVNLYEKQQLVKRLFHSDPRFGSEADAKEAGEQAITAIQAIKDPTKTLKVTKAQLDARTAERKKQSDGAAKPPKSRESEDGARVQGSKS